jgi:hypothetical protein
MFVVRNRALGVLAALSIAALLVSFSALFDATADSSVQQQGGGAFDRQADTVQLYSTFDPAIEASVRSRFGRSQFAQSAAPE